MASNIDISGLTMNPLEVDSIGEFIIEKITSDPVLNSIHAVWTGVKMNEQIVFASQLGLTGIKDTACTRPNSGAQSVLTQKNTTPKNVGDTLVHCQKDVDALFKAYYTKVNKYSELFDIRGSDLEKFLMVLLSESAMKTVWRLAWLGDTAVAAADASNAGLIAVGNVKFFDVIDGIWKQIYADQAGSALIPRTTVKLAALNALTTPAAQTTLASGDSVAVFEDMWGKADSRLRADSNGQILVTREIFENYRQYLQGKGENFDISYTMDGFPSLSWNGVPIVNMESVWDDTIRSYFVDDTTNNAYDLPNRAVYTVPSNIPITTLNTSDMDEMEVFYEQKERQMYTAYGYTLDALFLEAYMMVVAY